MNIQAALVRAVLEKWRAYEWSVQGFGFLRTKIADVGRIHVWDSRLATPLVSTAHTHPWPLHSTIISGELINQRFFEQSEADGDEVGLPYARSTIRTGEGGGLSGEPSRTRLIPECPEFYYSGSSYAQRPEEIRRAIAQDGTVTLIQRPQGPPLEEAIVYWPAGTEWVSAELQEAQAWEVERSVNFALARWCP